MAKSTSFYNLKNTNSFLVENRSNLKSLAKNIKSLAVGNARFFLENTYEKSLWIDSFRILIDHFKESEGSALKNAVIEGFYSTEKYHPGSGYFYLLAVLQGLLYESEKLEDLNELSKLSKRANQEELRKAINLNKDEFLNCFIDFCLNEAGFGCTFSIKDTRAFNSKFLLTSCYEFPVAVLPEFLHATRSENFLFFDSKTLVYDGVIETVGEIHHLLESFSENKLSLFLVARGFSNDVINTLAVNYNRGSLKIIPAKLLFSLESINSLKDFAIACDSEYIDSNSGKSISGLDFKDFKSVHHIEIDSKKCSVRNPRTSKNVLSLVFRINNQIKLSEVEDKKEILRKRVNCLSGRKTTVYLGEHLKNSKGITKDRLLSTVGILNTISRHGILNLKDIGETNLKNLQSITNFLLESNMELVPAASFIHGTYNGFKTAQQIKNGSYMLLLDKK